ncbi:MAG: META domain-containing protein [Muribaculaceae bacterium]|nr:META domain-containing protein [Muribaculaceae bacterium]
MKVLNFLLIALLAVSCSGNKEQSREEAKMDDMAPEAVVNADVFGQWYIKNIFFSDSAYVRPADEVPGSRMYVLFEEDGAYSVMTNCNHGAGLCQLSGNAISFEDAAWTELACDNMKTEEAMRKILPMLRTVEIENDSVMRINSETGAYLILIRATETK